MNVQLRANSITCVSADRGSAQLRGADICSPHAECPMSSIQTLGTLCDFFKACFLSMLSF